MGKARGYGGGSGSAIEDAQHDVEDDGEQEAEEDHGGDWDEAGEAAVGEGEVAWQLSEKGTAEKEEEAAQHEDCDTEDDEEFA